MSDRMMKKGLIFLVSTFLLMAHIVFAANDSTIAIQNANLFDQSRNRIIPILIYFEKKTQLHTHHPLVILNHGYTIKNSEYSFIANNWLNRDTLS